MLFNSFEFIFLFLPVVWIFYHFLIQKSFPKAAFSFLVLASLFFYGYWSISYLALLIFSLLVNFAFGKILQRYSKKFILVIGIIFNLSIIIYFKYSNFFIDNINLFATAKIPHLELFLPLGISFFTFQQITYLCDIFTGKLKNSQFLNYVLYLTFFPHLLAGPITHYLQMVPQFEKSKTVKQISNKMLAAGWAIFVIGLFKKVVLADHISPISDALFNNSSTGSISFLDAWVGTFAYAFQIYYDFSGYSDMAIGLALLFGIELPLNFYSPYKAVNIIEFWRRWHMTLSKFLRDYLYIPLGGGRVGAQRRHVNLMIVMLFGGLWHGAGWNFIIWGGLHGTYLIVNHAFQRSFATSQKSRSSTEWTNGFFTIVTFLAVCLAWIFFRAPNLDAANNVLKAAFNVGQFSTKFALLNQVIKFEHFYLFAVIIFITWGLPNVSQIFQYQDIGGETKRSRFQFDGSSPYAAPWVFSLLFFFSVVFLSRISPFLYFQF